MNEYNDGYSDGLNQAIGKISELESELKEARKQAFLEAAEIVKEHECDSKCGVIGTCEEWIEITIRRKAEES